MNLRIPVRLLPLLLLCCMLPAVICAQPESLFDPGKAKLELDRVRDTARIDLLLRISEVLLNSQPRDAFGYAREAYTLSKDTRDLFRTGLSCRTLANVYQVTAVYDKALEYSLEALDVFESLKDTLRIAQCYEELGIVHMSSGDFAEAQDSYQKALRLNKAIANHAQISHNYMNMGLNYLKNDSVDKGLSYFLVSLMIADSLKMEPEKVALLNNIGYAYARLGRHEEALAHFYKVLDLLGEKPDDLTRSDAKVNIAQGYYEMKNYPAALKYAREAYALAISKHFDHIGLEAAGLLSDIYAARAEYKPAYDYERIYRRLSDTIMNAEKAEQLARIRTLYDVNLKEEENVSLRKQIFQNMQRVRARTLVIIIITTLVLILATLLYLLNRMNNRQISLNKKLAAQRMELETLNDLKDKFFSFVAHNLKNPFNTIMGFSELMQRAADTNDAGKIRQYSGLIYDLSAQVQKVLNNLLEWSRLQRRTFEVKPETVELTGLIKDVVEMNNKDAARKDINLSITHEGNIFVVADRTMITAVLQNLVTNAIQFTPPSGQISIDCKVNNQFTEVTITDTGIGISEENLARLFDFDFSQTKIGTSDHSGGGLGLVICHEMLVKNGGNISVKSKPGKGTSFTFTLPVSIRHDAGDNGEIQSAENTPEDLTDMLLSSEVPLNAGMEVDFRNNIVPLFEEVSKVLSLENLVKFSKSLTSAGEKYHHGALTAYGKSLYSLTLGHQIDQIIRILPRFRDYLKKIHVI